MEDGIKIQNIFLVSPWIALDSSLNTNWAFKPIQALPACIISGGFSTINVFKGLAFRSIDPTPTAVKAMSPQEYSSIQPRQAELNFMMKEAAREDGGRELQDVLLAMGKT